MTSGISKHDVVRGRRKFTNRTFVVSCFMWLFVCLVPLDIVVAELAIRRSQAPLTPSADIRGRQNRISRGQCRVLAASDAAEVLRRSSSPRSAIASSRLLSDLRRRIDSRTIVLCKAVASESRPPEVTSLQEALPIITTASRHNVQTSDEWSAERTLTTQQPTTTEKRPDDFDRRPVASTGSRQFAWNTRRRLNSRKQFLSASDHGIAPVSGTFHRLRHPLRHRRHRKHIPLDRKQDTGRSRRTPRDCSGLHGYDDVTEKLELERVVEMMKAFNCWDGEMSLLIGELRQLKQTESSRDVKSSGDVRRLDCKLMRSYDNCRRNFIDKVFRTGHGLTISWPQQILDVMDRDDYSVVYY